MHMQDFESRHAVPHKHNRFAPFFCVCFQQNILVEKYAAGSTCDLDCTLFDTSMGGGVSNRSSGIGKSKEYIGYGGAAISAICVAFTFLFCCWYRRKRPMDPKRGIDVNVKISREETTERHESNLSVKDDGTYVTPKKAPTHDITTNDIETGKSPARQDLCLTGDREESFPRSQSYREVTKKSSKRKDLNDSTGNASYEKTKSKRENRSTRESPNKARSRETVTINDIESGESPTRGLPRREHSMNRDGESSSPHGQSGSKVTKQISKREELNDGRDGKSSIESKTKSKKDRSRRKLDESGKGDELMDYPSSKQKKNGSSKRMGLKREKFNRSDAVEPRKLEKRRSSRSEIETSDSSIGPEYFEDQQQTSRRTLQREKSNRSDAEEPRKLEKRKSSRTQVETSKEGSQEDSKDHQEVSREMDHPVTKLKLKREKSIDDLKQKRRNIETWYEEEKRNSKRSEGAKTPDSPSMKRNNIKISPDQIPSTEVISNQPITFASNVDRRLCTVSENIVLQRSGLDPEASQIAEQPSYPQTPQRNGASRRILLSPGAGRWMASPGGLKRKTLSHWMASPRAGQRINAEDAKTEKTGSFFPTYWGLDPTAPCDDSSECWEFISLGGGSSRSLGGGSSRSLGGGSSRKEKVAIYF
jgi:hypothetical protein